MHVDHILVEKLGLVTVQLDYTVHELTGESKGERLGGVADVFACFTHVNVEDVLATQTTDDAAIAKGGGEPDDAESCFAAREDVVAVEHGVKERLCKGMWCV